MLLSCSLGAQAQVSVAAQDVVISQVTGLWDLAAQQNSYLHVAALLISSAREMRPSLMGQWHAVNQEVEPLYCEMAVSQLGNSCPVHRRFALRAAMEKHPSTLIGGIWGLQTATFGPVAEPMAVFAGIVCAPGLEVLLENDA